MDAGPRSRIIKLLVYLPQVEHFLLRDGNLLTPPVDTTGGETLCQAARRQRRRVEVLRIAHRSTRAGTRKNGWKFHPDMAS